MKNKTVLLSLSLALAGCGHLFCCSIFSWSSPEGRYLGTNEAWFNSPSYVLRLTPPENGSRGFASFLHEGEDTIQGGMNDAGLSFDWVAGYESDWKERSDRETIDGQVSRRILERAATVDEAIAMFRAFNDPSLGVARMLIADASGASAIVGWKGGDVVAVRAKDSYQSLGFMEGQIGSELSRLRTPSIEIFVGLLERNAQRGTSLRTSYSAVYDLERKSVTVIDTLGTGQRLSYDLPAELAKGGRTIRLRDLFSRDGEPSAGSAQEGHRWPYRGNLAVKLGAGYFSVPGTNANEKNLTFPLPLASLEYEREGVTAFVGVLDGAGLRYRNEPTGLFVEGSCGFGEARDSSGADGETKGITAPIRLSAKAGYGFGILTLGLKAELLPSIVDADRMRYCGRYGAFAGFALALGPLTVVPEVSAYLMNQDMARAWYSTDGAPPFSASPGLEKATGSLSLRWAMGYHFSLNALVLSDFFLADARKSPVVNATQASAGIFLLYRL